MLASVPITICRFIVTGPAGGGGFEVTGPFQINGGNITTAGAGDGTGTGSGGSFPGTFSLNVGTGDLVPDNALSTYLSPYTFDLAEALNLEVSTPSAYNVETDLTSGSSVTVTYTYSAAPAAVAPETASLSLLGVGAVALLVRQRRMASAKR